jgi:hypothetical protein
MSYGAEYGLEISENQPRGTLITVRIPLEKKP